MRVCVFGGAGFVGSHVTRRLLGHGHDVVALVRDPRKAAELARLGAVIKTGDLRNRDDIRSAVAGARVVINLAVPSYQGRMDLERVGRVPRLTVRSATP